MRVRFKARHLLVLGLSYRELDVVRNANQVDRETVLRLASVGTFQDAVRGLGHVVRIPDAPDVEQRLADKTPDINLMDIPIADDVRGKRVSVKSVLSNMAWSFSIGSGCRTR